MKPQIILQDITVWYFLGRKVIPIGVNNNKHWNTEIKHEKFTVCQNQRTLGVLSPQWHRPLNADIRARNLIIRNLNIKTTVSVILFSWYTSIKLCTVPPKIKQLWQYKMIYINLFWELYNFSIPPHFRTQQWRFAESQSTELLILSKSTDRILGNDCISSSNPFTKIPKNFPAIPFTFSSIGYCASSNVNALNRKVTAHATMSNKNRGWLQNKTKKLTFTKNNNDMISILSFEYLAHNYRQNVHQYTFIILLADKTKKPLGTHMEECRTIYCYCLLVA